LNHMASSGIDIGIALVLVTMLLAGAKAQSGCTNVLISMAPCVNYVTGSSSIPSSSCCSSLASVVQSQPQCLCNALSGGGSALGININQTLALALPVCSLMHEFYFFRLAAANGPAASPLASPESSPPESLVENPDSPTSSSSGSGSTRSQRQPMAGQGIEMGLVLVLVTMLWRGAAAQSCTNVIISMSPCLNYISGNSSTPSSGCCTQLATVVKSQPQCLCQVLNGGGSSLGLNINQTQALALPGACKVQTPPTSRCNAASPAGSPAGTPESSETVPSGTKMQHYVRSVNPKFSISIWLFTLFCLFHTF
ncbi:hypothetical protein RJ639_029002, partial [Escallonia herrerae]